MAVVLSGFAEYLSTKPCFGRTALRDGGRRLRRSPSPVAVPGRAFRRSQRSPSISASEKTKLPCETPSGAIAIVNACAEQRPDQKVIAPRKEAPPPRVFAIDPPAHDDRNVFRPRHQKIEIVEVELGIGIGERHQRVSSNAKAGFEAPHNPGSSDVAADEDQADGMKVPRRWQQCDPYCRHPRSGFQRCSPDRPELSALR